MRRWFIYCNFHHLYHPNIEELPSATTATLPFFGCLRLSFSRITLSSNLPIPFSKICGVTVIIGICARGGKVVLLDLFHFNNHRLQRTHNSLPQDCLPVPGCNFEQGNIWHQLLRGNIIILAI